MAFSLLACLLIANPGQLTGELQLSPAFQRAHSSQQELAQRLLPPHQRELELAPEYETNSGARPPFNSMWAKASALGGIAVAVGGGMGVAGGYWTFTQFNSSSELVWTSGFIGLFFGFEHALTIFPLMSVMGAYFIARANGYEVTSFAKPYLLTVGTGIVAGALISVLDVAMHANGLFAVIAGAIYAIIQPLTATAWVDLYTEDFTGPTVEEPLSTTASFDTSAILFRF